MGMLRKKRGRPKKHHETITKEQIWCSKCHDVSVMSNSNVSELVCGICMQRELYVEDIEEEKTNQKKTNRPRGWHRKKLFVDEDGTLYSFGKVVDKNAGKPKSKRKSTKSRRISKRNS